MQLFVSKRLIQGLAAAMMGMFVPIFIYETTGDHFWAVCLFFLLVSVGYATLLVPGMHITNRIGFSRALALAAVLSVANYGLLLFTTAGNIWWLFFPIAATLTAFRIFHWVPYHVDFTSFTSGASRGRDVSLMFAAVAFMGMLGPILAGYIVSSMGYSALFMMGAVLLAVASVSYLLIPAVNQEFTWTYKETLAHMFAPRFRNVLVGEIANGAETIVTMVAWPVFLYRLLDGNLLQVGALSTVIVAITVGIQLLVGHYLDRKGENKVNTLKRGSVLYAIGWVIKIFVISATQVFLVGLYHNVARIFTKTPYNTILYDMSGEQGQYIDEFSVMREMSNQIGRAMALLIMLGMTFYFSLEWTFIIAALASLLFNVIYREHAL